MSRVTSLPVVFVIRTPRKTVPGDGDCLIWSLLYGLRNLGFLPGALAEHYVWMQGQVRRCRAALIALPQGDARKPAARDLLTNAYRFDASDEEHDASHLQFDVHAEWLLRFFLRLHKKEVPRGGMRLVCCSRFDDILGAPESILLSPGLQRPDDDLPLEIVVYNHTGASYCGYHYDLVEEESGLPPHTDKKLPAQQSELLRNARSHTRGPNVCGAEQLTDLATRFSFVPALLLAVLVSVVFIKRLTELQHIKT